MADRRLTAIHCVFTCWAALVTSSAVAGFDFADIRFWAGAGENRAALVIDWSIASNEGGSAAWGYRWADSESPTGADMLLAVLAADTNLVAKLSEPAAPELVYGIGYNAPGSPPFALADETVFDQATGIAESDPPPGTQPAEAIDRYQEGWSVLPIRSPGFWHYTLSDESPYTDPAGGTWVSSTAGFFERNLLDGVWDGWTFDPTFRSIAFPDEPVAAPTPTEASLLAGDYNRDGLVNAADYTLWRDTDGTQATFLTAGADGDANGVVDTADDQAWRDRYSSATPPVVALPEPSTGVLGMLAQLLIYTLSRRTQKRQA